VRTPAQQLGDAAEALVAARLTEVGWIVHARNIRVGRHELDIVATDPGPPPTLVFVEVRWRARRDFGLAEETIDHRKRAHLRSAAMRLLDAARAADARPAAARVAAAGEIHSDEAPTTTRPAVMTLPRHPIRFDLVVVEPGGRLRHHRHAM
jgi:putative endonuclease